MLIRYGCATLRPIEERDFDLLFSMINDPDIEDMIIGWNWPISEYQQREFMRNFKNGENSVKLVIELENGKAIGMMSIDNIDWKNRTATSGYKVSAPFEDRIKGDTRDALIGLMDYAFNELGMNCMYGLTLEDNHFSQKLGRHIPSKVEGVLRQRIFKNGVYKNLIVSSTLRDEFNAKFRPELVGAKQVESNA
ncbi:MAG: GNAT family N-acetyltransferase [Selenomonadaceae bacterium]|nr:GNAT family N-acetyltransferase [Selenomonadaceae bacterium]